MRKYKLAVLSSHPIQYQVPLFKKLSASPTIDLKVYFCSNYGVKEKIDPGFRVKFKWNIPLLEGYDYKFLQNYSFFPMSSFFWLINPGIVNEIMTKKYDAILIHGYGTFTNWVAFLIAFITKTPVLFHGETTLFNQSNRVESFFKKILFSKVKSFLYIGKASKEFYKYYGVPEDRLFSTPYSVDNEFFITENKRLQKRKHKIKEELCIPPDIPVVLYISKLIKRKRPFDLIFAFNKIKERAVLVFVGDGELKHSMEDYVNKNKIKNVFFLGFKNQKELPMYYSIGDIFVLPSSYESWGLVINEAMCFELPIITTNKVACAQDLVYHGENGFVYSVGDIESLSYYVKKLLIDEEMRKNMGKNSLKIISYWNYDKCVEGILQALRYCVDEDQRFL
jgi:glycosyltransferase involved in cell wall biosynthesis